MKRNALKSNIVHLTIFLILLFSSNQISYSQPFPNINNDTTQLRKITEAEGARSSMPIYMDTSGIPSTYQEHIFNSNYYDRYYSKYGIEFCFNSSTYFDNDTLFNENTVQLAYPEVKGLLEQLDNDFGSFTIIDYDGFHREFAIVFDNQVNLSNAQKLLRDSSSIVWATIRNFPKIPASLPNDRSLTPGILQNQVQNIGSSFFDKGYHSRGFGWHHYSLKTPLAWEMSQGDPSIVIANYDAFDADLPVSNVNLTDVKNRFSHSTDGGNWLVLSVNDPQDGPIIDKQTYPISGYKGSTPGHGLEVASSAVSYGNNDNLTTGGTIGARGGHIGTSPKSTIIVVGDVGKALNQELRISQLDDLDVDLTNNGKVNRVTTYNMSSTGSIGSDLTDFIDKGIVTLAPACNDIDYFCGNTTGTPCLRGDANNIFAFNKPSDSRNNDPDFDYKSIAVAGLSDGFMYNGNCQEWITPNSQFMPVHYGSERFAYGAEFEGYNYSPGTDKFNMSDNPDIRLKAKANAFVDVVAPATAITTISSMTTVNHINEIIHINNSGTSFATPYVQGIVGLMSSINRYMSEPLNPDGTPIEGINVQKKFYDIITFTAEKVIDDGWVRSGHIAVTQPNYLLQSNDRLKRWWAQRMGFGKVNAYRSVVHSIANKAPYEINSSSALQFADDNGFGDSRGYVNPDGKQLIHMGSKVKEGAIATYPMLHFWQMNTNRGPSPTSNDGIFNVLDFGGVSIPFIPAFHNNSDADLTNDHANYNNQGVTLLNSSQEIKLSVNNGQILAIDGLLIGFPENAGHDITTSSADNYEGLILVEGYIRDVALEGNLRVGDLILDGSNFGASINASCLNFGKYGTVSEIYGKIIAVNNGLIKGNGGAVTVLPGSKIKLLGQRDLNISNSSVWHIKGGVEFYSPNKKLIVESNSKLYIDKLQNVDLNLEVVVKSCAELIIEQDAILRIKKLIVEPGGTLTINEGAHITLESANHQFLGKNYFNGTIGSKILFRANTERNCLYENNTVIGTTTVDICNTYAIDNTTVTIDPSVTVNSVSCAFPCPSNSDWLTVETEKGGTCTNPNDCKIIHKLIIPDEYLCSGVFTHYKVETILNGVTTTSSIFPYAGHQTLPGINRCIAKGASYTVKVYLYKGSGDPAPCLLTKSYHCACNCPETADSWFTLSSGASPDCGPNQCKVTGAIDIPEGYSCYTKYRINIGGVITGPFDIPTDGIITQINKCINPGSSYTATIYLMKTVFDQNPCIITKTTSCDYDCCDFININFISKGSEGSVCCWEPKITTTNSLLCNLSNVSVAYFDSNNDPISLNSEGELCLSSTSSLNITYVISIGGVPCTTKSIFLTCNGCTCPPSNVTSGWLQITAQKGMAGCGIDDCKISGIFNIDPEYSDCFTGYAVSYKIRNNKGEVESEVNNPTINTLDLNGAILGLPNCIGPGQTFQIEVKIYKNGTSEFCTLVSNQVFCERTRIESRPQPCTPDNLEDEWDVSGGVTVKVGNCEYWVTYRARKTADGKQDVQMTSVEKVDEDCSGTAPLEDVFIAALPVAIADILEQRSQFDPQEDSNLPCVDTWRVVQNSCWSKWKLSKMSDLTKWVDLFLPCVSECCVKQLRVCNYEGIITVQDLGFSAGSGFNCSLALLPLNPANPPMTAEVSESCTDKNCDIYNDIDIFYDDEEDNDIVNYNMEKISNDNEYFGNIENLIFQVNQTNESLELNIRNSKLEKLEVQIHNTLGQLIYSNNIRLNKGMQSINIDISSYITGIYYINLINDGITLGKDKIIIVK